MRDRIPPPCQVETEEIVTVPVVAGRENRLAGTQQPRTLFGPGLLRVELLASRR